MSLCDFTGSRLRPNRRRPHLKGVGTRWNSHRRQPLMSGVLTDGAIGKNGVPLTVTCPKCEREFASGPIADRRGRTCYVCHIPLFPELDRTW